MNRISIFGSVMMASLALVSCQRELESEYLDVVRFSVEAADASDSDSMEPTRTSFGGVSSGKRSMTWSSGDRVSIYSPDAMVMSGTTSTHPAISYNVSSANTNSSHVSPVNSNTHLLWGTGSTQAFYGKYPDPAWSASAPYSASANFKSQTAASSSFTCFLPSILTFTPTTGTYTYAQDMTYCYMTAYTTASRNASSVTLPFTPDVTTFRITVPHSYVAGVPVTSVTLSSDSHRLSGDYSVNIASTHSYSIPESSLTAADKSVVVYFTTPVTIPSGSSLQVTLFTCPVDASDLTLSITTFDGNVLTLPLKNSGGNWLSFTRCRFYNITCGSMPEVDPSRYDMVSISGINVTGATVLTDTEHSVTVNTEKDRVSGYDGMSRDAKKTPWKAYYCNWEPSAGELVTGDSGFSDTPPSWIQVISGSSGAGKDDVFKFRVNAAATTGAQMNPGSAAQAMINKLKTHTMVQEGQDGYPYCFLANTYFDATEQRVKYSLDSDHFQPANCYIVDGAGIFCLPLVYGNGVIDPEKGGRPLANADNNYMGSPIILEDGNLTKSAPYEGCVLWQDTPRGFEIVRNVDVTLVKSNSSLANPDYLAFAILSENIKPGNVVLALRDATGKILWSWHIWVRANIDEGVNKLRVHDLTYYSNLNYKVRRTMKMLSEPLGYAPPISYVGGNAAARSCYVCIVSTETNRVIGSFPVNTAYYHDVEGDYTSAGHYSACYYQWGRKDPFPGTNGATSQAALKNKPVTSSSSEYNVRANDTQLKTRSCSTLGEFVKFPYLFNTNGTFRADYQWNCIGTSGVDAYPSGTEIYTGTGNLYVFKTVYDPCPAGFHVPEPFAFTGCIPDYHTSDIDLTDFTGDSSLSYVVIVRDNVKDSGQNGESELFSHYYTEGQYPNNPEWPAIFSITNCNSGDWGTYTVNIPALGWRGWGGGEVNYKYDQVWNNNYPWDYQGSSYCYYWCAASVNHNFSDAYAGSCMYYGLGAGFDIVARNRINNGFSIMPQLDEGYWTQQDQGIVVIGTWD